MRRAIYGALGVAVLAGAVGVLAQTRGGGEVPDGADVAAAEAPPTSGVEGEQHTIDHSWPSKRELGWLKGYLRWERDLHAAVRDAVAVADDRRDAVLAKDADALSAVRAAAEPVSRCDASLTRAAGTTPSQRLRVLREGALDACALYVEAFRLMTAPERYDGDLEERVSFEFDQGFRAFTALAGRLPLGAQRELPEREGGGGASHVEPRFTRAAGEIAAKEVEVRCWAGADWRQLLRQMKLFGSSLHNVDGFAIVGGGRVHLSPQVCAWIHGATRGGDAGAAAQSRWGYGLLALAHEAQHSQGVADEAEATCYALQTAPELTHALEIDPARIERLVEVFWTEFNALPAEYRSPECRAGGALDLHPGDGRWP